MNKEYTAKLRTPKEAASLVKSGDRVYVGTASSFAYELMDALYERKDELEDIEITLSMSIKPSRLLGPREEGEHNPFSFNTYFLGTMERIASRKYNAPLKYTSFHLSELDYWATEVAPPDVCFLEVSRPDEDGYMSFGSSGIAIGAAVASKARVVCLEANAQTPYITGKDALIHASKADAIIETDNEVSALPADEIDEVSQKISDVVLAEIPDGATIQLGLGGLSTAIGYGLKDKNDLGVHSELFSEPMMHLMKNGNITNKSKGFLDGYSVFAFSLGSKEMYDYMDKNPVFYGAPFSYVNDPRLIARCKKVMSINTAMSIDLLGQVAADNLAGRQQSACGGQLDFVRGAQWSEGGKSIIAMASSFMKDGKRQSKIALNFPVGTAVTTPRADVQYVATEYGCINLKRLTMSDRVRAMISLAHPDFRDELTCQAKDMKLI